MADPKEDKTRKEDEADADKAPANPQPTDNPADDRTPGINMPADTAEAGWGRDA